MRLDGIHHISSITADAPRNVDFYARVLGLRLVKKTVNQDDPSVYHLFYASEEGAPGSDLTFFEYPGARRGRPGAGMIHTIAHRVGSPEAIDFWEERLGDEGVATVREGGDRRLRFTDPEGLAHELLVPEVADAPLIAHAEGIPDAHALQGFDHVRALTTDPARSAGLLGQTLGFTTGGGASWEARGERRGGAIAYERATQRGVSGAGTVHHVAWAAEPEHIGAWQERVAGAGAFATPVIERFYFRSVYFREPSGVLFEIATTGPGFAVDEPAETLGEALSLPPDYEPLRERLAGVLTPLPDTRRFRRGPIRA